ncbi:MAG TPA: HRDC domain-containing protein [Opitutaceae bacterium]|nr:HRDC domain-containing protein [Opitutaceae bacterium]
MISRFLPQPVRRLLGATAAARPPHYALIDRPEQLAPLLHALDQVQEVSLDTEADNMFRYRVRVCLLQFLVGGEVFLVDALAPLDLKPLWSRLAKKHLVMHGSDFDLRLLHDLTQFRAHSLFDTMLAAQLLGRQRIGLASLLEEHFGVQLDKNSQKANWSKRPLTPRLLDYAALDVWHLPALRDLLTRELRKLGRTDWLEQQCRAQIDAGSEGFSPPGANDWRIGHSEKLRGKGLSVLHAVWHWREQQAERLDTPPFKVCSNEVLLKLARAAESGGGEEAVLAPVHLGKRHGRLIGSLTAAVRAGLARDPHTLPRRPGRDPSHQPLTHAEIALLDRIKEDRDRIAAKLGIEATLIANRALLAQIARSPRQLDALLLPWQANLLRDAPSLKAS